MSAAEISPESRKRRAPETGHGPSTAAAAAGASSAPSGGVTLELDEASRNLSVEEYLRTYLKTLTERAQAIADDAVDGFSLQYKQLREELQNARHQRKMEQAARNKAGRKRIWDVCVYVEETAEGNEEMLGKRFIIRPRQTAGGMCKIGRSTGDDFKGDKGVSLAKDYSVSTWHGKFTSVYGTIYYTDLNTKNGSKHNGWVPLAALPPATGWLMSSSGESFTCRERIEKDTPVPIKNGDSLTLGDTVLRIELVPGSDFPVAGKTEAESAVASVTAPPLVSTAGM